jgi:hypothetical protein
VFTVTLPASFGHLGGAIIQGPITHTSNPAGKTRSHIRPRSDSRCGLLQI